MNAISFLGNFMYLSRELSVGSDLGEPFFGTPLRSPPHTAFSMNRDRHGQVIHFVSDIKFNRGKSRGCPG
jgi:hypothetical protein